MTVAAITPRAALVMENQPLPTVTGWLKVTVMGDAPLTATAPLAGVVLEIVGAVGAGGIVPTGVENEKSSTARPWSLPASLRSAQRRTSDWPATQVTPVTVAVRAVLLALLLPGSVAIAEPTVGEVKPSAGTSMNVPVPISVPPIR